MYNTIKLQDSGSRRSSQGEPVLIVIDELDRQHYNMLHFIASFGFFLALLLNRVAFQIHRKAVFIVVLDNANFTIK